MCLLKEEHSRVEIMQVAFAGAKAKAQLSNSLENNSRNQASRLLLREVQRRVHQLHLRRQTVGEAAGTTR